MAIKLIIEDQEPNRALLIMEKGDVLECKTSSMTLHYDKTSGRPSYFEGYLKVQKRIPAEVVPLSIDSLMKTIEFQSISHAKEVLSHLESAIPELKVTGNRALDAITDTEINSSEEKKKVIVKEEEKEVKVDVKTKPKDSQKGAKDKQFTKKVKDLSKLKDAMKDSKHKVKSKFKKPQAKSEKAEVWPDCIVVGSVGYFQNGYVLAHKYNNSANEEEVIILNSPKVKDDQPTYPYLFAKEKQADYFLNGLINHPRWKETASMFSVTPLKLFDMRTVESAALLVKNPKALLNAMAKRSS